MGRKWLLPVGLIALLVIGAGVSRGDYRSVLAIALLTALAIGGYSWYHRRLNVSDRTPPGSPGPAPVGRPSDS
jgi:hypothetical protein